MATSSVQRQTRKRGCRFYAGTAIAGLVFLLLLGVLLGWFWFKRLVYTYTDAQPIPLPIVHVTDQEAEMLNRRVEAFQQALRQQSPVAPLALSGREINALIASNPAFKDARGKAQVLIESNQPMARLSVPLDTLGLQLLEGRYLNATALLRIRLDQGSLEVYPERVLVRGKPLPAILAKWFRSQNLAKNINEDPRVELALENLEQVQFSEGRVVIEPKSLP